MKLYHLTLMFLITLTFSQAVGYDFFDKFGCRGHFGDRRGVQRPVGAVMHREEKRKDDLRWHALPVFQCRV